MDHLRRHGAGAVELFRRAGSESGDAAAVRRTSSRLFTFLRLDAKTRRQTQGPLFMFSNFFIDRPIFATVLSIVIVILGGVAYLFCCPSPSTRKLRRRWSRFGHLSRRQRQDRGRYRGHAHRIRGQRRRADALHVVQSTNDGQMYLDVTFEVGTNLDMAQVLVQNRVSIAEAKLPEEVKRQGVTTKKKSPSILLVRQLDLARRELRPASLEQFRLDEHQGRTGAAEGRGRRGLPRPARLQHESLARSQQAGLAAA